MLTKCEALAPTAPPASAIPAASAMAARKLVEEDDERDHKVTETVNDTFKG